MQIPIILALFNNIKIMCVFQKYRIFQNLITFNLNKIIKTNLSSQISSIINQIAVIKMINNKSIIKNKFNYKIFNKNIKYLKKILWIKMIWNKIRLPISKKWATQIMKIKLIVIFYMKTISIKNDI